MSMQTEIRQIMKQILIIIMTLGLFACNQQTENIQILQTRVDSLQGEIDHAYKPGLGEFMSSIQVHHNKLWFAGQDQNWKLADFEIKEIKESLADIKEYCKDRPETKDIGMIDFAMDSLSNAIQLKNLSQFKSNYLLLTQTCNSCHRATNHGYNLIKIPDTPAFSNQVYKTNSTPH